MQHNIFRYLTFSFFSNNNLRVLVIWLQCICIVERSQDKEVWPRPLTDSVRVRVLQLWKEATVFLKDLILNSRHEKQTPVGLCKPMLSPMQTYTPTQTHSLAASGTMAESSWTYFLRREHPLFTASGWSYCWGAGGGFVLMKAMRTKSA